MLNVPLHSYYCKSWSVYKTLFLHNLRQFIREEKKWRTGDVIARTKATSKNSGSVIFHPYRKCFTVRVITVYDFFWQALLLLLVAAALTVDFLKIPDVLTVYKGSVITEINDVITATGLGEAGYYGDRDLMMFLSNFLLVIFFAGSLLLAVALTGCCGGCCRISAISKLVFHRCYTLNWNYFKI